MEGPIIIPRDHDRVLDLPLPTILREQLHATPQRCTLVVTYVTDSGAQTIAATHDFAPLTARGQTAFLRKRLPAPPSDLRALRLTFEAGDPLASADWPALSPDLADYGNGSVSFGDLPDFFPPGACAALPVTVRNESPYLWEGGPTGAALRVDLDGEVQLTSLPATLLPGTECTFDIPLQIPRTPGERPVACSLVLAPSLPFGRGRTFKAARGRIHVAHEPVGDDDHPALGCHVAITPPATPYLPGAAVTLLAHVRNAGAIRIEAADPGGIRLRARWRRVPRTGVPIRDPVSVLLPYPLEPECSCIVALDATAPSEPGDYEVDVIAEQIGLGARLSRQQCESPAVMISVADPEQLEKAEERRVRAESAAADEQAARAAYRDWARHADTFADAAGCAAAAGLDNWPSHPAIGVMLPKDTPDSVVEDVRRWLMSQPYPAWRLLLSGDRPELGNPGSTTEDERSGSIPLLLHWDPSSGRLADHALLFFAGEFAHDPALAFVYADYDMIEEAGRHSRVFLPAPDPFFARAQPQLATVCAARTSALASVGISPDDPHGAARLLTLLPETALAHVPQVLFHAYGSPPVYEGQRSITSGPWHSVNMHDAPGYAVHAAVPAPAPRVALIIPTRDRLDLLASCIGSVLDRTTYPEFELLIIDNGSEKPATLQYLRWLESEGIARVLRDDGSFNWSRLNNRAAALTDAEIVCFLNNDVEVTSERWLSELVGLASQPEVGVAGPTLWFPNGTMQHVGVVFSSRGSPLHPFRAAPRGTAPFYLRSLRTQPAVTGACLTVRRAVFEAVGGFAESFPLGFNDVDFCLRVKETLGLPSVCTPAAELLHKESASRGRLRSESDHARFLHDLALFEGRHLETALADRWAATVAHEARRNAPLTMVARKAPGARAAARRYRRMAAPRTAFIHIPKTAGTAIRKVLERALPDRAVISLGARAVVEGHAGDLATAARLAPLLRNAEILISHVSHGFGEAIGWPCRYATVLRAPRERVRSHHGFLVAPPNAPLRDTPVADWSIAQLLRKGIIPGNLMLAKVLGTAPEPVGWPAIDGRFPRYAGFGLPAALWHGDMAALAALPDIAPDQDEAKVAAALAIIERDFMFVGLQERLDEHLPQFGRLLDVPDIGSIPQINGARLAERPLSEEDLAAIDAYNALDRLLYDSIAARPGGLFLSER
ncbi:glycosyltransferase family 2 protein [Sphingomonas mucosissima]|uniref:N-acetylglucosaminyl-diphospho-decaprenol L-rhamnosyltransferase n=1 Tax=Sphingomonas mucosissima TaxID=370959 RepID=A0A245ZMG3_9SPHN|nr:glycosyltransferase family 2 protein [Sphingomonas mucosissima]OWK30936.1 N-acetylglucosaminyl-diphospho-decaprenol L-rhamnosyltransferase [Sphingomonas mucosissima]